MRAPSWRSFDDIQVSLLIAKMLAVIQCIIIWHRVTSFIYWITGQVNCKSSSEIYCLSCRNYQFYQRILARIWVLLFMKRSVAPEVDKCSINLEILNQYCRCNQMLALSGPGGGGWLSPPLSFFPATFYFFSCKIQTYFSLVTGLFWLLFFYRR